MFGEEDWDGRVWGRLFEECESGNVSAIKLYFELSEKLKNQMTGGGNGEGTVVIVDDIRFRE